MKRIDFLGANGIGKSTVYRRLLERRSTDAPPWLTLVEAKRTVAVERFLDGRSPIDLAKVMTCYLPKMGDVFVDAYTIRPAERAFIERGERHQHFFEHLIEHLIGVTQRSARRTLKRTQESKRAAPRAPEAVSAVPLPRLEDSEATPTHYVSLFWIFARLKELCLLDSLDHTVVFDESLTHAVTGLLADTPSDLRVRAHFEKIPVPESVVHLATSENEVLRRIRIKQIRHGGPIVRHRGLDEAQLRRRTRRILRIAEIGASTLAWRGADLLHLDAMAAPEENARRIKEFVGG